MKRNYLFLAAAAAVCISFTSCKKDKVEVWRDDTPTIDFNDPRVLNALIEISAKYGDYPHSDGQSTYVPFKDMNGDGKVSEMEASRVEYLDLSGYKIRNLDELTYFTSLKVLYCQNNDVSRINVTQNTALTELNCMNNKLTDLDVSKNTSLTTLNCRYNSLTSLNVGGCASLSDMVCEGNSISVLSLDGCSGLTDLNCSDNMITSLDVSGCPDLKTLNCSDNRITRLDVSHNKYLSSLSCSGNPLEKILIYEYFSLPESFVYGSEFSDIIEFVMWD